jgi:hypothetical protein
VCPSSSRGLSNYTTSATKGTEVLGDLNVTNKTNKLPSFIDASNKIHSKINIFHTLALKIVKETLLNLTLPRAFPNNTKDTPKLQWRFCFQFYLIFIEKNGSIINSFHIIAPNSLKPSQCTLTHQEHSNDTKGTTWTIDLCLLGLGG